MESPKQNQTSFIDLKTEKKLFFVATAIFFSMVVFVVLFFLRDLSHVKRSPQIGYQYDDLTDFEWVEGDKRTPVELPHRFDVDADAVVVLETRLPDVINDDTWIDYSTSKSFKIYVDGELRKELDKYSDTIAGGVVKRMHFFVELYPKDAGKILRIERYGDFDQNNNIRALHIGTSLGLIQKIIMSNVVLFVLAIVLLVISVIAICIGILIKLTRRIASPITSVGVAVLFVAIWQMFDSELYQLAFQNYYIDGVMAFIMMQLIPYPFIFYLNMLQKNRYRTLFSFLALFLEVIFFCAILLQFSGVASFIDMYVFLSLCEGIVILGAVITLIVDFAKKYYKEYLISFIGVIGFIVSCVLELILIQTVENRTDGTAIIGGLFWLIILAIIHQLYTIREAQTEAAMAVRASETKSNFLANMSHEIRTPMNAILGMDEMILREANGNKKIVKYASDIKSAGNMLLAIINDILDISKIESGNAELINADFEICSVFNDIINITKKRALDKDLSYTFDAAEDIPVRYNGDEIRVRQIMLNIINNAVKYTKEGGVSIEVSLDNEAYITEAFTSNKEDETKKAVKGKYDNTDTAEKKSPDTETVTLKITVKDTGIGIREEDREKLFTPFDRLEESKNRNIEGTGLGLNIAYNYINMMGGSIEVDSVYGEGSTFTIYMPLTVIDKTPIGKFTQNIHDFDNNAIDYKPTIIAPSARALIVDDNAMNLEVISGLMESTQIRIDTALSGQEGIDMMEKRRYDIIFLDQMMPGMDGATTLAVMHEKFDMRGISVIALTADAVAGAKEFYLEKGFDDYLSKPVKTEALEKMLKKHLPEALLLKPEDIERVAEAEKQRKLDANNLKSVVVIDSDGEALKKAKASLNGVYKGTFVTDREKADKYLTKHDVEYIMIRKELYDEFAKNKDEE